MIQISHQMGKAEGLIRPTVAPKIARNRATLSGSGLRKERLQR